MSKTTRTAEITCQYVNQKKAGKTFGSIKSSEGDYYFAMPSMLNSFREGEVCKIEFTEDDSKGSLFRQVTKKIGGAPPASPNMPQVRSRTNPVDSENMFTTALLKSFIEAGKLELSTTEVVAATNAIRQAYRMTFGGSEAQRNETDMQDEIPEFR